MRVGPFLFKPAWLPSLFAGGLLALLLWLGMWQLGRAELKAQIQSQYQDASSDLPLRLEPRPRDLEGLRYHSIQASGSFEQVRQFLLDNRTHDGRAGYHVLTPLRLDAEFGVIINRGWVPVGPDRAALPDIGAPAGKVFLTGKLFPPPKVFLLGSSGYQDGGWPLVVQSVEIKEMETLLGYRLLDSLVMMNPERPGGYVREWHPYYGITPSRHRAYAFQWFALGTALVVIYLIMTVRRAE